FSPHLVQKQRAFLQILKQRCSVPGAGFILASVLYTTGMHKKGSMVKTHNVWYENIINQYGLYCNRKPFKYL
ncbi:MAG: hypothetical protein AAGF72_13555, partial [Pseudomonadota bacterium]